MDRETRANLILIAVVVALLIPGAIIVVRKKMDPTIKPMGSPDPVRAGLVYIDPTPAPATVARLVPAVTASWTRSLARSAIGPFTDARQSSDDAAVLSDQRLAEIVGWSRGDDGGLRVAVLIWDVPRGTKQATASYRTGDSTADVVSSELIPLPPKIMKDLQHSGYPAPPQQVLWNVVRINPPDRGELSLSITLDADGRIFQDTVRFSPR